VTFHRWVIHSRVPDYLLCGWMALPTLEGTGHGIYSAHCVWLCGCKLVEPPSPAEVCATCGEKIDQITQDSVFEVFRHRRFHESCYRGSALSSPHGATP
jgi:hypothetical protein